MKTVILAGGMGARISEESHLKPKPMIEIGGAPILWHIMKYYAHFGFMDFIICCGYKGYIIKEYFANYYLHRSDVTFDFSKENALTVHNNVAEPWRVTLVDTGVSAHTGDRVRAVRRYVGEEPFMLTYGDGVSDIDLNKLLAQHKASGQTMTISAVQPKGRYGVLELDENGVSVRSFKEKAAEDRNWINAGFMVLEPGVFDYIGGEHCMLEERPMREMAEAGAMGVYLHTGFWQCMDTQRDKRVLEELWYGKEAAWKVWEDE